MSVGSVMTTENIYNLLTQMYLYGEKVNKLKQNRTIQISLQRILRTSEAKISLMSLIWHLGGTMRHILIVKASYGFVRKISSQVLKSRKLMIKIEQT